MPEIQVNAANYALLRRFDLDGNGEITSAEAKKALHDAGPSRIANESQGLTADERKALIEIASHDSEPVTVVFGSDKQHLGKGEGQVSWDQTAAKLEAAQASKLAPMGSVGQSAVGSVDNQRCGPTSALFTADRRIQAATGKVPMRTHADADRIISSLGFKDGTTPPQMRGVLNDHFRSAGDRYYTFETHDTDADNLQGDLLKGLQSDPGGVMVPIVSTYNANDTSGFNHWIVVTGFTPDGKVSYYDPGGLDGANHLHAMSVDELKDCLQQDQFTKKTQLVYGAAQPADQAVGALKIGAKVGETKGVAWNSDIKVTSTHGIYGDEDKAREVAKKLADSLTEDAIVVKEGNGFAVYGISELRNQESSIIAPDFANMNKDIRAMYGTRKHDDGTLQTGQIPFG